MDVDRGIEREERRDIGWSWALKKGWSGAEGRETSKIIEESGPGRLEKLANCSVLGNEKCWAGQDATDWVCSSYDDLCACG